VKEIEEEKGRKTHSVGIFYFCRIRKRIRGGVDSWVTIISFSLRF
jgi:hypothetical protein